MITVSDRVLTKVRAGVAARQALVPLDVVKSRALAQPSALDGARALRGVGVAVIAEVDRSGLSMGELAGQCELGGANVVSVRIGHGHDGALPDLKEIRARVQAPVLCKGLIVSSYQLWEARAHGADLVLLIVAALDQQALVSLVERAESIGLTAVVEVRDEQETVRAMDAGARVISAGAGDPDGHGADRTAVARLISQIPESTVRVAECGPAGRPDLIAFARAGVDAVVLGPHLLAGNAPRETVAGLVSFGAHPALSRGPRQAV